MRNWRASSHSTQCGTNYAQWRKSCRNSTKCQEAPSTQFFWPSAHRLRAATPTKWFRTISWQCFMRHMHIEAHISDQTYQKREILYHGRFDITTHKLYIFVYNYLACTAYIQFRVSLAVETLTNSLCHVADVLCSIFGAEAQAHSEFRWFSFHSGIRFGEPEKTDHFDSIPKGWSKAFRWTN